jgi:hypothetical protein
MSSSTNSISLISEELRNGLIINIGISGALGFLFNIFLAWVLIKKIWKGGAHGDIKLCAAVAITDLIVSIGLIFRAIFVKYPYNIIKYHPEWCKVELGTTGQLLVYSGYTIGVVSLERFLLICFNIKFSVCFWFLIIAGFWISQFTIIMIAISNNLQILSKIEVYCTVMPIKSGYAAVMTAVILFFISFFSVIISYTSISIVTFKQSLDKIHMNVPKDVVYKEFRSILAKSLINITIYILVFSGKLFTFLYEISTGKKRTLTMDAVSNGLIVYSSVANSLILLYYNKEVRGLYIDLLLSIKNKLFKSV